MLQVVLFDLDGTLWENPVRWDELRRELGLPPDGLPIYWHIARLPPGERERAEARLREREAEGVRRGQLKPGAWELLRFLREKGVRRVLVTNNSRESAAEVLRAFPLPFDLVWTREDGALKPDAEAFLGPLRKLGIVPEAAAVVGDSHLDLQAAHAAGIPCVILVAPRAWMRPFFPPEARFLEAQTLAEVQSLLAARLAQ
ncbi:MAG: HAD family phosphatase [Candidatus Bipolaricaulota bacterium]|nr:HAD family phosphatase [Candidatus Bipolaricaulota bacterium]MDW8126941.1 HAD family phosphatase [Candidatus Bipolaricaulota bacterium]